MVVPGVEGKPSPTEEHLEPGAEVHGRRIARYSDVAQIARAIARRNIHAPAQRDRQMSKDATDADPFLMAFGCGAVAPRVLITELNTVVDIVADRLHALPCALDIAEERPGEIAEFLGVAVAAAEKKDQG